VRTFFFFSSGIASQHSSSGGLWVLASHISPADRCFFDFQAEYEALSINTST
jgi:hypothetical protein